MLIDDMKEAAQVVINNADALQDVCNIMDESGRMWEKTSIDVRNSAFAVLYGNLKTITREVSMAYTSVALVRHLETDAHPRMDESIDRFVEEALVSLDQLLDRMHLLAEVEDILNNWKESE